MAEAQIFRNASYSHWTWNTHVDFCTVVPRPPKAKRGLLHGGHYYKVASRLNKVLWKYVLKYVEDVTCSKYSDSFIVNHLSMQPTPSAVHPP